MNLRTGISTDMMYNFWQTADAQIQSRGLMWMSGFSRFTFGNNSAQLKLTNHPLKPLTPLCYLRVIYATDLNDKNIWNH